MLKHYSSEADIQKEIEFRESFLKIIETREERRIQLQKIEWLQEHLMNIHAKKQHWYKVQVEQPTQLPQKSPEHEALERQALIALIDSVALEVEARAGKKE